MHGVIDLWHRPVDYWGHTCTSKLFEPSGSSAAVIVPVICGATVSIAAPTMHTSRLKLESAVLEQAKPLEVSNNYDSITGQLQDSITGRGRTVKHSQPN